MLQNMSSSIEEQKKMWIENTMQTHFKVSDPTRFSALHGEYEIKNNGLEFLFVYKSEIISRFKPKINFSVN